MQRLQQVGQVARSLVCRQQRMQLHMFIRLPAHDAVSPNPFNAESRFLTSSIDMLPRGGSKQCVPHVRKIIIAGNCTPMKLLHMNDYVIEKTFVYAIICLSRFLGSDWFSWGIFTWPPAPPPSIYGSDPDIVPVPDSDAMPSAASASVLQPSLQLTSA